jgi:hypothetical protein
MRGSSTRKPLCTFIIRQLSLSSKEVIPQGTRVTDEDIAWRFSLSKDDVIDCIDQLGCWYESTVLEVIETEYSSGTIKEMKIGFRVYSENGTKSDMSEPYLKYEGWSNTYDVVINAFSNRIQPRGLLVRKGKYELRKIVDDDHFEDESSDILINVVY